MSLWSVLRGKRVDPLERWTSIREQHGDVARYRYTGADTYFISSADGVKRVLQDNVGNYTKEHGSYQMLRRLFGNGLLTSEGSFWLRQRRLAQPAFHRQRLAAMAGPMTAAALEVATRWEAATGPLSMMREMSALTLRVVGDALFGVALAEKAATVAAAWDVLNTQLAERFSTKRLIPPVLPTAYDRAFREARRTLFTVVDEIIRARRARPGDDLLSMLMEARDEDTGEGMTDAQLRDEIITLLLAGHETTAVALTWVWARLDAHAEVAMALHDELDRVLAGRAPTADDLPRLPVTRAVIQETLRLHPPAYILSRRVKADDVVCGFQVHAGGTVVMSPLILHRHPAYWERPEAFVPERWLDAEAEKQRPKFAYLPFSLGPRQCIGNSFSLMESTLILAALAQRFTPAQVERGLPKTEYLVLARPAGPVSCTIASRPVQRLCRAPTPG
ncbi:MAG: cytochrome P450 [Archangiaceae bacterium]|nr:cytochrome P450 [Archangiaceae bacterium]